MSELQTTHPTPDTATVEAPSVPLTAPPGPATPQPIVRTPLEEQCDECDSEGPGEDDDA